MVNKYHMMLLSQADVKFYFVLLFLRRVDFHDFVAEVVDYFDGDSSGGRAFEGSGNVAV